MASPKTVTTQYIVLFSHLMVQLPVCGQGEGGGRGGVGRVREEGGVEWAGRGRGGGGEGRKEVELLIT